MAGMLAGLDIEVLKVPLGFIRVVQLPFVIIAFASMSGWGFDLVTLCNNVKRETVPVNTFSLDKVLVACDQCVKNESDGQVPLWGDGYSSTGGFFVFTGVVSMLVVIAMLVIYLFFMRKYESDERLPLVDFVVTVVLTIFWFIGTICWWTAASGLGSMTSIDAIIKLLKEHTDCGNSDNKCEVNNDGHASGLAISVIAGWACVLLFGANVWFIFKETIWFRNRQTSNQAAAAAAATSARQPTATQQQQPRYG